MLVAADTGARYSIDACSLINLHHVYPQSRFPGLWEKIAAVCGDSQLFLCQQARDELHDIGLVVFIDRHISPVHLADFEAHLAGLMSFLDENEIQLTKTSARKTEADPFVIALALKLDERDPARPEISGQAAGSAVVVTDESPRSNRKIPAVCSSLNLHCANLLDFFEAIEYVG
jgi:hypothetical protein